MDDPKGESQTDEAISLPGREALSIIGSGSSLPLTGMETAPGMEATGPAPDAATGTAGQATGTADQLISSQASGSGQETVTAEDRSESFESSDSAYSET